MMQNRSVCTPTAGILVSILIFIMSYAAFGQRQKRIEIKGKITDSSTGEPIFYANVFLDNTTRGTTSGRDGHFIIKRVPFGRYQLVVAMMGYERQVRQINVLGESIKPIEFNLKPKAIESPTISISARYPVEWKRLLKKFQPMLLGITENAVHCEIKNPEILDLHWQKETHTLIASASTPLRIENRALGYKIDFYLLDFSSREDDFIRYRGESQFTPLQTDDESKRKFWDVNRRKAYQGSMKHFFKSLIDGNVNEAGYDVYRISSLPKRNRTSLRKEFQFDSLITQGPNPHEIYMTLPSYLQIIYKNEEEPAEIQKRFGSSLWIYNFGAMREAINLNLCQISVLEIHSSPILIHRNGTLYFPYLISTHGHWTWERLSDMLPMDYNPQMNE